KCKGVLREMITYLKKQKVKHALYVIVYCENSKGSNYSFNYGSNAARNPSPNKLNPSTTKKIAMPGKAMTHGAVWSAERPSLNIAPHSGVGGCAPSPKKLNPAASKIAVPIPSVAWTMIGATQFGKTCWMTILPCFAPIALAASIYSISLTDNTAARTILAN